MSKSKPSPLPPGTQIGGYRVVRRVAAGGFGVVYLAAGADEQQVAIKEYLPSSLAEKCAASPSRARRGAVKVSARYIASG